MFMKNGRLQIKNSPVNIVTVIADLLFVSLADSLGQELFDKRFTAQIQKLMKDTTGGIPASPIQNTDWMVYQIFEEEVYAPVASVAVVLPVV